MILSVLTVVGTGTGLYVDKGIDADKGASYTYKLTINTGKTSKVPGGNTH